MRIRIRDTTTTTATLTTTITTIKTSKGEKKKKTFLNFITVARNLSNNIFLYDLLQIYNVTYFIIIIRLSCYSFFFLSSASYFLSIIVIFRINNETSVNKFYVSDFKKKIAFGKFICYYYYYLPFKKREGGFFLSRTFKNI